MILDSGFDCKHYFYEKISLGKAKDLSGERFNKLTPLFRVKNNKGGKKVLWLCLCECNNLIVVAASDLFNRHSTSCGCFRREKASLLGTSSQRDLTNQIFYGFTVLQKNKTYKKENQIKSKNLYWDCKCLNCGKISTFNSGEIIRGNISCNCLKGSKGEQKIRQLLEENNISYIYDRAYFKDLIMPGGGLGRYDFILLNEQNKPYRLIEFDGRQHNEKVSIFNSTVEEQQLRDEIKNNYAKLHSIPLVRIPNLPIEEITIDILLNNDFLI